MSMRDKLERYYTDNGILATRITCSHRDECCWGLEASYELEVMLYGSEVRLCRRMLRACPRFRAPPLALRFAGLGERRIRSQEPVAASVRQQTIEGSLGPKNRHWYRTHELAARIFNRILETCMTPRQAQAYFAHTNAAKCCQNKLGRRQADKRLFDNCR